MPRLQFQPNEVNSVAIFPRYIHCHVGARCKPRLVHVGLSLHFCDNHSLQSVVSVLEGHTTSTESGLKRMCQTNIVNVRREATYFY